MAEQDYNFSRLKETMRWRVAVVLGVVLVVLMLTLGILNTQLGLKDTAQLSWLVLAVSSISLLLLFKLPRALGVTLFFSAIALLLILVHVHGLYYGRAMHYWAYVFPPLLVFLVSAKRALVGMLLYGIYVVVVMNIMLPLIDIIRFTSTYGLIVCFIFTYAFLEERAAKLLRDYSNHDALSNCLNRRTFNARLEESGNGADANISTLLLLDIDHFKSVNDNKGHLVGDQVIAGVAQCLLSIVRKGTPVFRYGGEEFAILLDEQDEQAGWQLAERLREAVAQGEFEGAAVTMSIGVAERAEGDTSALLIARADRALYAAKAAGRNCTVRASGFTPL